MCIHTWLKNVIIQSKLDIGGSIHIGCSWFWQNDLCMLYEWLKTINPNAEILVSDRWDMVCTLRLAKRSVGLACLSVVGTYEWWPWDEINVQITKRWSTSNALRLCDETKTGATWCLRLCAPAVIIWNAFLCYTTNRMHEFFRIRYMYQLGATIWWYYITRTFTIGGMQKKVLLS